MKVIAGLGNPGRKYEQTRHNVGFLVIDELSRRWDLPATRQQFEAMTAAGSAGDERVLLLKPMTYMNRSGRSVRAALTFHKLEAEDLLVVVDDLALPLGRLRLRPKGSAGGHNGLSDVINALGDDAFARLRIGIEWVAGGRAVGHVLGRFSADERDRMDEAVSRAADAAECWLREGLDAAMNRFNRPDESSGG